MKTTLRSKFYLVGAVLCAGAVFIPPIDWRSVACLAGAFFNGVTWWETRLR